MKTKSIISFIWFLFINGALDKFTFNMQRSAYFLSYKDLGCRVTSTDWIQEAFTWSKVPENFNYWMRLNGLWRSKHE